MNACICAWQGHSWHYVQRHQRTAPPQPPPKADRDLTVARWIAKAIGADPEELMEEAEAKAKAGGFCTGRDCRVEEIQQWALRKGGTIGGPHGVFANAWADRSYAKDLVRTLKVALYRCTSHV